MYGFIVVEDSFSTQVAAIAEAINLILRLRGLNGSADWYWDDTPDGYVEHGVKIDLSGLSPETAIEHLRSIWQLVVNQYSDQEVRLEIPRQ